jgi:selT/selW/selH-like putative selenoprotein
VFEVTLDGRTIFSKKATGRFPEHREILDQLAPPST